MGDLDARRGVLVVRQGKGRKDRVVPVGERALLWVGKYEREVRPEFAWGGLGEWLFVGATGEPLKATYLTKLMAEYVDRAALGKRGSCHLFRHACATLMLEGGADIRSIQQMLGHARLDTTQIYTQVSIGALKAIHEATHPGAKLRARGEAREGEPEAEGEVTREELMRALEEEADEEEEHEGGVE